MNNKISKITIILIALFAIAFIVKININKYGFLGSTKYRKEIKEDIYKAEKYVNNKYNIKVAFTNGYVETGGDNFNSYYAGTIAFFKYKSKKIKVAIINNETGKIFADDYQSNKIRKDYAQRMLKNLKKPYHYSIELRKTDFYHFGEDDNGESNVFTEYYDGTNIDKIVDNKYQIKMLVEYIGDVDIERILKKYNFLDYNIDEFTITQYKTYKNYNMVKNHNIKNLQIGVSGGDELIAERFRKLYIVNGTKVVDRYLYYDGINQDIIYNKW